MPTPTKLRLVQIENLANAIAALDRGVTRIVTLPTNLANAGAPNEQIVNLPYNFSGDVRFRLFRNFSALAGLLEDFNATKKAVAKKIFGTRRVPDEIAVDTPEAVAWEADINPLREQEHEIPLHTITQAELQLDLNPIPISVLRGLEPILTG